MIRKRPNRELRRLQLRPAGDEHLAIEMRHPHVAALLVLIDQPHADFVALAFFSKRLQ